MGCVLVLRGMFLVLENTVIRFDKKVCVVLGLVKCVQFKWVRMSRKDGSCSESGPGLASNDP